MGESGSFSFKGRQSFSDLIRVSKETASLRPLDRVHIREEAESYVRGKLDPPPSDARPEQLKEIYLIASEDVKDQGKKWDDTLASLTGGATASDLEDALSKLGEITEKCARAEERAIVSSELYANETGEKLDDSGAKILGVGGQYAFRKAVSMATTSVLATYGVPPVLAQFLGYAIGRAVSDAVLGPRSRAERVFHKGVLLSEHVLESGVDGSEYLHEGCEDYPPMIPVPELDDSYVAGGPDEEATQAGPGAEPDIRAPGIGEQQVDWSQGPPDKSGPTMSR